MLINTIHVGKQVAKVMNWHIDKQLDVSVSPVFVISKAYLLYLIF